MHSILAQAYYFLSVPSNIIAALAVLGLVMTVCLGRSAVSVAAVALVTLVAATLSPAGNILLFPLEHRFPTARIPSQEIDGIIVLGRSYDSQSHGHLSSILLEEDTEPMSVIPDIARRYPRARIIFSGGTDPSNPGPREAAVAKEYFVSLGIAADRISIEDQSLTTKESAQFTAALVHPSPSSRWLLVTSAYHLPLAMGAFRKAGFNVIGFSVGLRTHGADELWRPAKTATDNLRRVDIAVAEWLNLLIYRLSGFSDEWFPGPLT